MTDQSQSKKAGVMIPIPQVLSPQIYPAQFLVRCVNHLASVPVPTIQCQLGGIQHGTSKNLQNNQKMFEASPNHAIVQVGYYLVEERGWALDLAELERSYQAAKVG